jgi:hypothetical protein
VPKVPRHLLVSRPPECVRESRARRAAQRQGRRLYKHMRRDEWLLDGEAGLTLEEVEAALFIGEWRRLRSQLHSRAT